MNYESAIKKISGEVKGWFNFDRKFILAEAIKHHLGSKVCCKESSKKNESSLPPFCSFRNVCFLISFPYSCFEIKKKKKEREREKDLKKPSSTREVFSSILGIFNILLIITLIIL